MEANKENLSIVLDWFKKNPHRWCRGLAITHDGKCCMIGAAAAHAKNVDPIDIYDRADGIIGDDIYRIGSEFLGIDDDYVTQLNDDSDSVEEMICNFKRSCL